MSSWGYKKGAFEIYGMFHYVLFYWLFVITILLDVVILGEAFVLIRGGYHALAVLFVCFAAFIFGKMEKITEDRSLNVEASKDDLYHKIFRCNHFESYVCEILKPQYKDGLNFNLKIADIRGNVIKYGQVCHHCPSRFECVLNGISCSPNEFTRAYLAYNKMPVNPKNIYKVLFLAHCGWMLRMGRKNVKSG